MGGTVPNSLVTGCRAGARLLRREGRVVTVLLLVGVALSLLVLGLLPDRYSATTSVLVNAAGAPDPTGASELSMDTETEVVTSTPVVEAVRRGLGTARTPGELAAATSVRVEDRGTILVITHEASSPEAARAGAAGFARAYLRFRTGIVERELADRLSSLRQQAETVRQRESATRALLAGLPDDRLRSAQLRQQLLLLEAEIERIDQQTLPLLTATTRTGDVVDRATLPTEPSGPPRLRLAGLLAGVVLAGTALIASWRDRRGGRLRDLEDLANDRAAEVAAVLPRTALGVPSQDARRLLGTLHAEAGDRLSVLVVGADGSAPAWAVSRSLAATSGRQRTSTVLAPAPGLVGVTARAPAGVRVLHLAHDPEVTVGRVLQTPRLPRFLARLAAEGGESSLTIVTASPTSESDDAQAFAPLVDLVLVVAEIDRTRKADLRATVSQLRQVGARAVQTVVVAPPPRSSSAPQPTAPERRRVSAPVLAAGLASLLVVLAVPLGWRLLAPGAESSAGSGATGSRAPDARAAAAESTPGRDLPGIHVSVRAQADGTLSVVEQVVARRPIEEVHLEPPAVPDRVAAEAPRLVDVRLRAEGSSVRVAQVDAGGTDVTLRPRATRLVLRYEVVGAATRDEQAPEGRAVLSLRPATAVSFATAPVVTRLEASTVHTLVCGDAPPAERLCGIDDGATWRTRPLPASQAAVVALVDLLDEIGAVGAVG